MMMLLTFAHKKEARSFIDRLEAQKSSLLPEGLFESDSAYILIIGEGLYPALSKTSFALGTLKDQNITAVYNIGVCGGLDHDINPSQPFSVRTIYGEDTAGKLLFKSFNTADSTAKTNLISAHQRVLTDDYAKQLAEFAPLVDREAWAVGLACQQAEVPFYCYKLVSDTAGDQTQCTDISSKAHTFSEKLFTYFNDNVLNYS